MRAPGVVLSSAAVGLALIAVIVARGRSQPEVSRGWESALQRVDSSLNALAARLTVLESRVSTATFPESRAVAAPRTPGKQDEPADSAQPKPEDLSTTVAELLEADLPREETESLLDRVRKQRSQGALLKSLEARVVKHPQEAKAHYLLARALIEQLMIDPSYTAKEDLGNRALAEYDKAIALDPRYWEPRFEKADSLTYYPESLGKTPDAIRGFEELLELQGGSNHDPRFAGTYSHLGRLYIRVGKSERAEAILREGARLFPENEDLRKQLEVIRKK